jgi:predicted nucleic acid-binding protein
VILDDAVARRYASQAGLKVVGTLGILLLAKARGLVDTIAPFIEMLDSHGFRLHADTRASVLKLAGE